MAPHKSYWYQPCGVLEHSYLQFEFPPWPDLWNLCSGWQMGSVGHLPPHTHLLRFSSLASLPKPLGFCMDSAKGWQQPEVWEAREEWGRHIYFPTLSLQAQDRLTVSFLQKDTALARQPSCPSTQSKRSSPSLLSLPAAPPGCVPYTCPNLPNGPFIKPSTEDSVYTCHLFLGRP